MEAPKEPTVPLITINSVIGLDWLSKEVGNYDLKKIRREMQLANTSSFSENWWSNKHGHLDFSDQGFMEPLILKILDGALPPRDFCEKELLSNALFLNFMDKID